MTRQHYCASCGLTWSYNAEGVKEKKCWGCGGLTHVRTTWEQANIIFDRYSEMLETQREAKERPPATRAEIDELNPRQS